MHQLVKLPTPEIYSMFGDRKFPQGRKYDHSEFIGDFINHNIHYKHKSVVETFTELGRILNSIDFPCKCRCCDCCCHEC